MTLEAILYFTEHKLKFTVTYDVTLDCRGHFKWKLMKPEVLHNKNFSSSPVLTLSNLKTLFHYPISFPNH